MGVGPLYNRCRLHEATITIENATLKKYGKKIKNNILKYSISRYSNRSDSHLGDCQNCLGISHSSYGKISARNDKRLHTTLNKPLAMSLE